MEANKYSQGTKSEAEVMEASRVRLFKWTGSGNVVVSSI